MKFRAAFLIIISLFFFTFSAEANHVKGGWIGYKYLGEGLKVGTSRYDVTIYLYIDCHNTRSYTQSLILGAFDGATQVAAFNHSILSKGSEKMQKTTYSPCLTSNPEICYNVYTYDTTIQLPDNQAGYNLNVQFRARVNGIVNIQSSAYTGITLFTHIPGKQNVGNIENDYHINNSPQFNFLDTSVVCHNSNIAIPFSAVDPDSDSLSYRFGSGNDAGGNNDNVLVSPSPPPYELLTYMAPFSGAYPLGPNVTINPTTGLISGRAPDVVGEYVVAVYVDEWRKGVLISTSKKELQIDVTNCSLQSASLDPSYINCKDYKFTFQNNTQVNANSIFTWDFGVPNNPNNISNSPNPTFDYPDTGIYTLKLKVGVSEECTDSTTSEIKVYPGFKPGFDEKGNCILSSTSFTDATTTLSGVVNSWLWDFGDNSSSTEQNPKHKYENPGIYKTVLLVGNSKGCSDTISRQLNILIGVGLKTLFSDTTICNKDSVQLVASALSESIYNWTSNDINILDANTATPIVFPKTNTEYTVTAINGECIESKKIQVNLLGDLNLVADDIYVCIGDSATFNVSSQANKYLWTQISGNDSVDNALSKQPYIAVTGNNSYQIKASYGKNCSIEKTVQALAANYPTLSIQQNKDTTICLGNSLEITTIGSTTDNIWTPTNQRTANINVKPDFSTTYIIDGYDRNSYCSKHVQDTIVVNIASKFVINLTHDTTIVWNQPLVIAPETNYIDRKFYYSWSPSSYLSNTDSAITTATIPKGIGQQFYTVDMRDEFGCIAAAKIAVHIFQTQTGFFVPSAFTPNNDGKNDVIKPTPAGIKQLDYFKIYNRWGQLVYSTQTIGRGWNGYLSGQLQPSGSTYVYQVSGKDYNDKKIEASGTIVLIR